MDEDVPVEARAVARRGGDVALCAPASEPIAATPAPSRSTRTLPPAATTAPSGCHAASLLDIAFVSPDITLPELATANDQPLREMPTVAPWASLAPDEPAQPRTQTASNPAIDLGLDEVAQDVQSVQSPQAGVIDRRATRQIGELERQVAQLKGELDRAPRRGRHHREAARARDAAARAARVDAREGQGARAGQGGAHHAAAASSTRQRDEASSRRSTPRSRRSRPRTASSSSACSTTRQQHEAVPGHTAQATASRIATLQHQLDAAVGAKSGRPTRRARSSSETSRPNRRCEQRRRRRPSTCSAAKAASNSLARHQTRALRGARGGGGRARQRARGELRRGSSRSPTTRRWRLRAPPRAAMHEDAIAALERAHAGELLAFKSDHAGAQAAMRRELEVEIEQLRAALGAADAHAAGRTRPPPR